jgi:benzoyl-CoA 2,3-epoxidase subunit B
VIEDNQVKSREAPLRNALNEVLRGEYAKDCERGVARWNKILAEKGVAERLYLPSRRFHRRVGEYAKYHFDIHGAMISQEEFDRRIFEWLPTTQDREYVRSLMTPVTETGKIANWIAPPSTGTNRQPFDFEYVRL